MLPLVFDLFTQGPVSIERAQGGLGIGLTLVRTLVELHGGTVARAQRRPRPGQPLHGAPAAGQGRRRDRRRRALAADRSDVHGPRRALRVLVVDDNRDAADSLAHMLELMGHHVEVAYAGFKALRSGGDLDPDLVLLDIGLPEIDGYEVARRLRAQRQRAGLRLVALTGYGTDDDKRRSQRSRLRRACRQADVAADADRGHRAQPTPAAGLTSSANRRAARASAAP